MTRTLHGVLALSALLLLNGATAHAQVDRATLSGIVTDSGGGVLPGATVVMTSLATNVETRQQTSDVGGYQVGSLIPGKYRVEVELNGRVAYVFFDRVRRVAGAAARNAMDVMGLVMAHEIGHPATLIDGTSNGSGCTAH